MTGVRKVGAIFLLLVVVACGEKKPPGGCTATATGCQPFQQCFFATDELDHPLYTVVFINGAGIAAFIYYRVIPLQSPYDCASNPYSYLTVLSDNFDSRQKLATANAGTQIEVIVTRVAITPPEMNLLCNPSDPLMKPKIIMHYCGINGAFDDISARKMVKIFDIVGDGYGIQ